MPVKDAKVDFPERTADIRMVISLEKQTETGTQVIAVVQICMCIII
jgi:hypothetical protein